MSKQLDRRLLNLLKVVRLNVKAELEVGEVVNQAICARLIDLGVEDDQKARLYELFALWPKYSGGAIFPVPSPDSERNHFGIYVYASRKGTLWTGEYGALRMELLEWLIHTLETSDE